MALGITYENVVSQDPNDEGIFSGMKLWFSNTVPQRAWFIENAKANGAQIVAVDKMADLILYDHARKTFPPGAYSYRFVEDSIRNGKLADLDAHRLGVASRATRQVGSVTTAGKGTRTPFTEEDDQLLWNWVKPYMDAGGMWKGNEIYVQLEKHCPRHTYQSWRDRFIKYTNFQKRTITETIGPEYAQDEIDDLEATEQRTPKRRRVGQEERQEEPGVATSSGSRRERSTQREVTPVPSPTRSNLRQLTSPVARQSPRKLAIIPLVASPRHQRKTDLDIAQPAVNLPSLEDSNASLQPSISSDSESFSLTVPPPGFTMDDARMLYRATPIILQTPKEEQGDCWKNFAEACNIHDVDKWRYFFDLIILPEFMRRKKIKNDIELSAYLDRWKPDNKAPDEETEQTEDIEKSKAADTQQSATLSPVDRQRHAELLRARQEEELALSTQSEVSLDKTLKISQAEAENAITCSNCFSTASEAWRWRHGQAYCDGCAWFHKSNGTMRPSSQWKLPATGNDTDQVPSETNGGVVAQSEEIQESAVTDETVPLNIDEQQSLTLEPRSPSLLSQELRPNANEGRKRASQSTTTNSNSQPSQTNPRTEAIWQVSLETSITRESSEVPERVMQQPPEQRQSQTMELHGSSSLPASQKVPPSAQPQRNESPSASQNSSTEYEMARDATSRLRSPSFFVPRSLNESEKNHSQLSLDSGIRSSPPIVALFADEEASVSEDHQESSRFEPSDTESEYVPFDTAPEMSQLWKTTPDNEEAFDESDSEVVEDKEILRKRSISLQETSDDDDDGLEILNKGMWTQGSVSAVLSPPPEASLVTQEDQSESAPEQTSLYHTIQTESNTLYSTPPEAEVMADLPGGEIAAEEIIYEHVKPADYVRDTEMSTPITHQPQLLAKPQPIETQALFEAIGDDVNDLSAFDVPPPEGGWEQLGLADLDDTEMMESEAAVASSFVGQLQHDEPPVTANDVQAAQPMQSTFAMSPVRRVPMLSSGRAFSDAMESAEQEVQESPIRQIAQSPMRQNLESHTISQKSIGSPIPTSVNSSPPRTSRSYSRLEAILNDNFSSDPPLEANPNDAQDEETQDSPTSDSDESALDAWLTLQQTTYSFLGGEELLFPICTVALNSTCMILDIATSVVRRLTSHIQSNHNVRRKLRAADVDAKEELLNNLLPRDVRGCWTVRDDAMVLSETAWQAEEMERKHGDEAIELRMSFLEAQNKID